MRVLVTWGSKMGGTAGIGRTIADALEEQGHDVRAMPADEVEGLDTFEAVIVGGALYANRWPSTVRRFVKRNVAALRRVPVWFFSSGPLDDSAEQRDVPAPTGIAVLAERVGARGHVTFGGRLDPDAKGFAAAAMAKEASGDWRNPERIRAWATALSGELPHALPGQPIDHPARSVARLLGWGLLGAALALGALLASSSIAGDTAAVVLTAIAVPIVFTVVARRYFLGRGSRDPLQVSLGWAALVLALHAPVLASAAATALGPAARVWAVSLPVALSFLATWATGAVMSTMPWPKAAPRDRKPRAKARGEGRSAASPSSPETAHRAT